MSASTPLEATTLTGRAEPLSHRGGFVIGSDQVLEMGGEVFDGLVLRSSR